MVTRVKDTVGEVVIHHAHASEIIEMVDDMSTIMRSATVTRVAGYEYATYRDPRCGVCQSGFANAIEDALAKGYAKKRISRSLEAKGVTVSVHSMSTHIQRGHMLLPQTAARVMLEERAREIGVIEEDLEGSLVDHIALFKETIRVVFEGIVAGTIVPTAADGLNAAKAMASVSDIDGHPIDATLLIDAMTETMEQVRQVVSPDDFQRVLLRVQANDTLRSIDKQVRRVKAIEASMKDSDNN